MASISLYRDADIGADNVAIPPPAYSETEIPAYSSDPLPTTTPAPPAWSPRSMLDIDTDHGPAQPPQSQAASSASAHRSKPQQSFEWGYNAKPLHRLDVAPAPVYCPHCRRASRTRTEQRHSSSTWKMVALLTLPLPILAFLPLRLRLRQDVVHFCRRCGQKVAVKLWGKEDSVPCLPKAGSFTPS